MVAGEFGRNSGDFRYDVGGKSGGVTPFPRRRLDGLTAKNKGERADPGMPPSVALSKNAHGGVIEDGSIQTRPR